MYAYEPMEGVPKLDGFTLDVLDLCRFLIGVVVFSTWKSSSLTATTKKSATYIPRFVSSRGCTLIDDCPLP